MNCEPILSSFGAHCQHISESLAYIESPLTTAYDSGLIGAFVQKLSHGKYRLSDNAETLFYASVNQIPLKARKAAAMVEKTGHAKMAESGEIYMVCDESSLGDSYTLFVEHISQLGAELNKLKPAPKSAFQRLIGKTLVDRFGNALSQNKSIIGASGHEVTFQFALKLGADIKYINTIGAKATGPNWGSVYSNIGKLVDVRSANPNLNRIIVMQKSISQKDDSKAIAALADVSKVIIFDESSQLCDILAA
tara:strand:+ start:39119 stop:39868 length:750 start_codon:yes stop_codon:yes gene_type:complete